MKAPIESNVSRRELMEGGLAGLGMAMLGSLAKPASAATMAPPVAGNIFVIIQLRGGNDGVNTIVPVTLSQYAARRGSVALNPSDCLSMASGSKATATYKMHPSAPNLNALWTSGELAVVNKIGFPQPNMSHFKSLDTWGLGVRGSFSPLGVPRSGWVARYADAYAPDPFGAVQLGFGRPTALFGGNTMRFMGTDLSRYRFEEDPSYLSNHRHRLNTITKVLARGGWNLPHRPGEAAGLAHDLMVQVNDAVANYASGVVYPNKTIATNLRDAAILLQANLGTRIVYTGLDGFDTHDDQGVLTGKHPDLLAQVDGALAAFELDLRNMGLWNKTVIALVSEFGRRNYSNLSDGTDHGGGNCMLLTGGAIRGGIYGTDLTNADLSGEVLPWEIDFRTVYGEILRTHMGVADVDAMFPEPGSIGAPLGLV